MNFVREVLFPMVAWESPDFRTRVVLPKDGAPIVEVSDVRDAMGNPAWRPCDVSADVVAAIATALRYQATLPCSECASEATLHDYINSTSGDPE